MNDRQEPGAGASTGSIECRGASPDTQVCILHRLLRGPGVAENAVGKTVSDTAVPVIQRQERRMIATGNGRYEFVVSWSQVGHCACLLDHTCPTIRPDHLVTEFAV